MVSLQWTKPQNATLNMLISASIGLFFRLLLYDLVPKIEGIVKKASGIETYADFQLLNC